MDLYYPNLYEKMRPTPALLRCSHCGSLEVQPDRCPDCGRIFHFDLLGNPLGERSFINLAHQFYQLPVASQNRERKSYLRNVRRREQVLHHYFQTGQHLSAEKITVALFQIELSLLTAELHVGARQGSARSKHWFGGLLRPIFVLQISAGLLLVNLLAVYFLKFGP